MVPFEVETGKAAEQRAPSEEGIITADDELRPAPRRCCDCICNTCLCKGIIFGDNPCCGMRTASIVCNVIAICLTVFYILLETVSWQDPDYEIADDFTSLTPE